MNAAETRSGPTLTRRTDRPGAPDHPGRWETGRRWATRVWLPVSVVLAVLAWWPVGFAGTADWWRLPLRLVDADAVALGALSAAAVVCALTRPAWARFLIVAGLSGLGWALTGPTTPREHELELLVGALVVGGLVGMAVGSRFHRGVLAAATALAVIAALTPLGWLRGPLLAVALALPFVLASKDRVAPTVLGVVRVLLVWLVTSVLALAARYGWDTVRPGTGLRDPAAVLTQVRSASWDLLRTSWRTAAEQQLRGATEWLWLALALAIVIVAARVLRSVRRRRLAVTSGAPRR